MTDASKGLLEYLGTIIERRELTSEYHCRHIRLFTKIMLEKVMKFCPEYELTANDCKNIAFAAAMHDVGKITISEKILQKPGRLTHDEFEIMKNHTRNGKKIFDHVLQMVDKGSAEYELFQRCAEVCLYHHERYDGEGYPCALKGDDIPISAQVVGLVDAYDALVSELIYKPAYSKEEAFEMILEGECGIFAPKLLDIFQMVRMELEEILDSDPK